MNKWTVVMDNDFGYPVGYEVDDPVKEFEKFVEECNINFNQIYLDTLDEFENNYYWYLWNGIRCYDEPTFESVKQDYENDFMIMWEEFGG